MQALSKGQAETHAKLRCHAAAALQALGSSTWPAAVVGTAAALAADSAMAACAHQLILEVSSAFRFRVQGCVRLPA